MGGRSDRVPRGNRSYDDRGSKFNQSRGPMQRNNSGGETRGYNRGSEPRDRHERSHRNSGGGGSRDLGSRDQNFSPRNGPPGGRVARRRENQNRRKGRSENSDASGSAREQVKFLKKFFKNVSRVKDYRGDRSMVQKRALSMVQKWVVSMVQPSDFQQIFFGKGVSRWYNEIFKKHFTCLWVFIYKNLLEVNIPKNNVQQKMS